MSPTSTAILPRPATPSAQPEDGAGSGAPDGGFGTLPARIGKYAVRRKLGEGATSEVFLAHDPFLDREVAIKRVRASLPTDTRDLAFQRRFFASEAALVGRLQHPNVVRILDAVADEHTPYLVMEYVPGGTLRRHCRPDQLLPLAQVVEIGFKCAKALEYCWRQGLVHRDVKPANILCLREGERLAELKITDFGSAFDRGSDHTQVYRVGSLAYMSPEQLDGDTLDCRSDMFSLSAVLYHLVAGRPPFDAADQMAIMNQIHHATPPPLTGLRAGVSPRLQAVIEAGLAKRREDRPADWEAFARQLSELVSGHHVPRSTLQGVLDSERFNLLRPLEFFAGFGDVELWEVVHRATWQRHPYGAALYRKGDEGSSFHIITEGQVEVYRDGRKVAVLGAGTSVGEMAYLAPNPQLRIHTADVLVSQQTTTTVAFTPAALQQLSLPTRSLFDRAFIQVLVRRLHAAHEALAHPRRIL